MTETMQANEPPAEIIEQTIEQELRLEEPSSYVKTAFHISLQI
jgi:hypothetical protein